MSAMSDMTSSFRSATSSPGPTTSSCGHPSGNSTHVKGRAGNIGSHLLMSHHQDIACRLNDMVVVSESGVQSAVTLRRSWRQSRLL